MGRKKFTNSLAARQADMRFRLTGSSVGKKRSKTTCPICWKEHWRSVPDECWKEGLLTKNEYLSSEFEKYIYENKKGKIIG